MSSKPSLPPHTPQRVALGEKPKSIKGNAGTVIHRAGTHEEAGTHDGIVVKRGRTSHRAPSSIPKK
jgi:hypothetical protein